jgi:hypothetical protein
VFAADWLSVQVSLNQAVLSTVEEGREFDLRDLVKNVFDLLPETPVDAVGLNADAHFRVGSEEEWHAIGDRLTSLRSRSSGAASGRRSAFTLMASGCWLTPALIELHPVCLTP